MPHGGFTNLLFQHSLPLLIYFIIFCSGHFSLTTKGFYFLIESRLPCLVHFYEAGHTLSSMEFKRRLFIMHNEQHNKGQLFPEVLLRTSVAYAFVCLKEQ